MKRVVVTGLGCISPLGTTVEENWSNVLKGKSGIGPITLCKVPEGCPSIAGEVRNFNPENSMDPRDVRKTQRFIHFAMHAAKLALADAGFSEIPDELADDFGVVVSVAIGAVGYFEEQHSILLEKGARRVSPFFIPSLIPNMAAGFISMHYGLRGPNLCFTTACASSGHSISEAMMLIQSGQAKVLLAGGAEAAISPLCIAGFSQLKATCSQYHDEPHRASRPFDKNRAGFVLGEGAGLLVLEEYEHAKARGARIYAELSGFGLSADAHHITTPHPEGRGNILAMSKAIKMTGRAAEEIGYINAHATSTPVGDVSEMRSIKKVFKDHAYNLNVSATKSMTGHLLGAAGGIEALYTVLALYHQVAPPTINVDEQDPECDLNVTRWTPQERKMKSVLSNSFGFGGTNVSLIFSKI